MKIQSIVCAITLLGGIIFSSLSKADTVWIDVRSVIEHTIDGIEGDIRVSHADVVAEVSQIYPDKDTDIRLYCRSGGRAEKALVLLKEARYTKVQNVGGIGDARKIRAIVE